jgi:4-diphosphocytidyl-2-C-methyl-D-erythritol kinase
MRIRTYAKVNLYLKIAGRRDDGYHDVDTIYHSTSLADEMELSASDDRSFDLSSVDTKVQLRDNLVLRAMDLLEERLGSEIRARIRLHKNIPVGAGLGGGSANAAGTLIGLNQLLGLRLSADELLSMAIELGSDVPFCMVGGTTRGLGRGEVLAPAAEPPTLWFVLGLSREPLMTRDVYDKWDEVGSSAAGGSGDMIDAIEDGELAGIARAMHNDLGPAAAALRPELEEKLSVVREAGALNAIVCGSGPSVLGLASDLEQARLIAERVSGSFDRVEVAHSVEAGIERLD